MEVIAMEQDEALQKAMQNWDNMSHNKEFRRAYEAREKLLLDEKAAVAHAERKGREQGLEKGRGQIIQQMYDSGMTSEGIATILKMSVEAVHRILHLS
ncbi:hypothetical protein [Bacillus wiedmannii]|uniref:hypothetical protein n=1 Tax=Bacillus wiedmannii TaxID=1890302 RepID=UPI0026E2DC66